MFSVTDVIRSRDLDRRDLASTVIGDNRLLFWADQSADRLPSTTVLRLPDTNQTGNAVINLSVTDHSLGPTPTTTNEFLFRSPVQRSADHPAIPDIDPACHHQCPTGADIDTATVKVSATSSDQNLIHAPTSRLWSAGTRRRQDHLPGRRRPVYPVTSETRRGGDHTVNANDGSRAPRAFPRDVVKAANANCQHGGPAINDNAAGTPYPSEITVTDLVGDVDTVRVKLNGLAHNFPSDIDVLLVAPNGKTTMVMSDAGGGQWLPNPTLTRPARCAQSDRLPPAPGGRKLRSAE
jgi:hypothetical protein